MAYVAVDYEQNKNAPIDKGNWVGILNGVPYLGTKGIKFDPKAKGGKQPEDGAREEYYGECVSYVKAVVPALLKIRTTEWTRGAKVSPGFQAHPHPAHGTLVVPAYQTATAAGPHVMSNPLDHLSEPSRFLTAMAVIRRGFQYIENESNPLHTTAQITAPPAPVIPPGTVIATFTKDGKYRGHAAIFEKLDKAGLHVVNQWINPPPLSIGRYVFRFKFGGGLHPTDVNDADNYYVVE